MKTDLTMAMDFLTKQGFTDIIVVTDEVFVATNDVFGKVAIKKVNKNSTEFEVFLKLKHECIVSACGIFEIEDVAFVLMEFAECGDVFDYIMKKGLLSFETTLSVFSQIVEAVQHCHAQGIAHCDIKLENVLLSKSGGAKLADFGFAKSCKVVAESDEFCGTLPYSAPEVIQGMEHNPMKADIWSMGVLLYVMLFGAFPFADNDASAMVMAQLTHTLVFPENTNESLKSLISSMLEPTVEQRADAGSILRALKHN